MMEIGDVVYWNLYNALRQGFVLKANYKTGYANVMLDDELIAIALDDLHLSKIPVLKELIESQTETIIKATRKKLELEAELVEVTK